jgi:starch synthase
VRVDVLSREYPPEVYGGAGVHVTELVRALRTTTDIDACVRAFGAPRDEPHTFSYGEITDLIHTNVAVRTLGVDLLVAQDCRGADVVHSHTWYANFAGHLASMLHGIPHVVTAHSLEPLRPWKSEQLGGGYAVSSWVEKSAFEQAAAIIAVSKAMRDDVLKTYPELDARKVHVVHNGIDTDVWKPTDDLDRVRSLGVDPEKRTVLFIGRITRQKGLPLLLKAAELLPPDVQLVLVANSPDTPEIHGEVEGLISDLLATRDSVVWIKDVMYADDLMPLLTHADVFACPSIYEPLGIVNLEAMACKTPVVATAVGGIPEVVWHKETGLLVPMAFDRHGAPLTPDVFVANFAASLTELLDDPERARAYGEAGRQRVIDRFSWTSIAEVTADIYEGVADASRHLRA